MKSDLEDRIVKFAARCVKVCGALPVRKIGSSSYAAQLFRSSTGVAANYAAAAEAESRNDFIHKLNVAMKDLSESRIWLKLIGESEYIEKGKLESLIDEAVQLTKILSSSVITARNKADS